MTKFKSKEGFVFVRKDHSAVYDKIIYLSDIDSADNYEEMAKDEAEKLKKEILASYEEI